MSDAIGHVTCPFCLDRAEVKRNKSRRLYMRCRQCGPVNAGGDSYQDWLEDQMEPLEAEAPDEGATTDPPPAPAESDQGKRRGSWLLDDEEV